jgi:hypothetical protein
MSKSTDLVNYVLTGSRYQVMNEKGEPMNEFGVGVFRSGIRLDLAVKLYVELATTKPALSPWNGEAKRTAQARELAKAAFDLSDIFLEEMDKHFRRPLPPPGEEDSDSVRIRK